MNAACRRGVNGADREREPPDHGGQQRRDPDGDDEREKGTEHGIRCLCARGGSLARAASELVAEGHARIQTLGRAGAPPKLRPRRFRFRSALAWSMERQRDLARNPRHLSC